MKGVVIAAYARGLDDLAGILVGYVVAGRTDDMRGLRASGCTSLNYEALSCDVVAAIQKLASGEYCSIQLRDEGPAGSLVSIYAPHFCKANLRHWTLVLERVPHSWEEATRG
jgi:hypothetical protein